MAKKTIGLFVGSLRKDANSKKIAQTLQSLAPADYEYKIIAIGDLPLYNQDYDDDNNAPEVYNSFREEVKKLNGVIFITPEYNRSVPAVLKNAIDVASRPYGKNMWNAKPGAVISSSIGALAGFGANHHLRQSLTFVNVFTLQQPEMYLGNLSADLFNDKGIAKDSKTLEFLQNFVKAYTNWVEIYMR